MGKGFRLQKILSYREEMERMRSLEFASAKQALDHATDRLEKEEHRLNSLAAECTGSQMEGMPACELRLYADFFQRKSRDIRQQRLDVESLNCRMAEKREILTEAARDKKALEMLKEKKVLAHRREMAGREQLFMEEIALRNKTIDR